MIMFTMGYGSLWSMMKVLRHDIVLFPFIMYNGRGCVESGNSFLGQTSSHSQSQHLITLTCVEDDALGEELQVIWEVELGAHVAEKNVLPVKERQLGIFTCIGVL